MCVENKQMLAYGINQAVEATSMGRSFLYEEIRAGNLKTFKVGARTLIAAEDLRAWLNSHRPITPVSRDDLPTQSGN